MQYRYVDEKTVYLLTEEGLEEWFWTEMHKALVSGNVKIKKKNRKFFDDTTKKHNEYLVIEFKRD